DTETGSAFVPSGAGFIGPDHSSDVEVRPRGIVLNEALNELRRGDRTGPARPHVLDVGDRRIDELVVSGGEREAPQLVTARLPRRTQLVRERVVVGEQTRMLVAERDDHRAGERRQIDDPRRLELALGPSDRV